MFLAATVLKEILCGEVLGGGCGNQMRDFDQLHGLLHLKVVTAQFLSRLSALLRLRIKPSISFNPRGQKLNYSHPASLQRSLLGP